MLRTSFRKLTKEQRERGVIYSSSIVRTGEREQDHIHEVMRNDPNRWEKISNLKDVTFFRNMARAENWQALNIVRQ